MPILNVPKVMLGNAVPLAPEVEAGGLAFVVANDYAGLGGEASRALAWMQGRGNIYLQKRGGLRRLMSRDGDDFLLSQDFGEMLEHHNQYFGMISATQANPIQHAELEAALLSRDGISSVRGLFERSMNQALRLNGAVIIPEIGGEATLGNGVVFHEIASPLAAWSALMSEVARLWEDPRGLDRLYKTQPEGMEIIDEDKALRRLLDRWPLWEAQDYPRKEKRLEMLRQMVSLVLQGTGDSYLLDPKEQFSAISEQVWAGRYVGIWHLHPPSFKPDGWRVEAGGELPSHEDMALSKKYGQNLTLVFRPDGFDAYDLEGVSSVGSEMFLKKISYRSTEWQRHFDLLHADMR